MRQAVDDHVGDDGDQHQRGDIGRGAKHAEHDLVGQILVDAALLAMGKGTLDALTRRGRIDRRVNGIGHSLPPLLGNQADDTHQCSGDDKQDNAHAKQSRAVQARGITHIERDLTRER